MSDFLNSEVSEVNVSSHLSKIMKRNIPVPKIDNEIPLFQKIRKMHNRKSLFQYASRKCPECAADLYLETSPSVDKYICESCCEKLKILRCVRSACNFQIGFCQNCRRYVSVPRKQEFPKERSKQKPENSINRNACYLAGVCVCILIYVCYFYFGNSKRTEEMNVNSLIKNLRQTYPSQTNETWSHFLGVLDQKIPSVKTITLMYSEDEKTLHCLTNELVFLFSGSRSIKHDEITFSSVGFEGQDYGIALEHYFEVVKKYRVFIADLTQVSGNLARIFHTLCDDVSSVVKPSLFIFSLKYDKKHEMLKPMERARAVLTEIWKNLGKNEFNPLLSRVVRNVIHIVPEVQSPC